MSPRRLLVVDADPGIHELLKDLLARGDRSIQDAYDGHEAVDLLRRGACDVVLAGQGRNGFDELKLLRHVRTVHPATKVILTADERSPERVVGAIRGRAYSYFHKPISPAPLADMVQQALDNAAWQDDIRTVSARTDWISFDIRCKLPAAERAVQFFREAQADLPLQTCEDLAAAFRELLLNAVEHGGKCDPRKRVRVSLVRSSRSLIGHIHDPGRGFSLDSLPHAAISNPDDSPIKHVELRAEQGRRPGGFGILMTRHLVDDLLYNERGNDVLFVKYL